MLDHLHEESGDSSIATEEIIDYFYDNLAEVRNEQIYGHGVYLGTMHSAKGLEFNHVFVADGGWQVSSSSPNIEDERRLFYVALTRAMETLTILSVNNTANPHIPLLKSSNYLISEFERQNATATANDHLNKRYQILGLKDLYLGFPGTFDRQAKIHTELAALNPGDPVLLSPENGGIGIRNIKGRIVSKLSKTAVPVWEPILPKIAQSRVLAMVSRLRTDEASEYQPAAKSEEWELPIIEVLHTV